MRLSLFAMLLLRPIISLHGAGLYDASVAAVAGASIADIASSRPRPGVREANPIIGTMDAQGIAIKSGLTFGVLLATDKLRRLGHGRLATILNFCIAGGTAAVAVHNTQVGR